MFQSNISVNLLLAIEYFKHSINFLQITISKEINVSICIMKLNRNGKIEFKFHTVHVVVVFILFSVAFFFFFCLVSAKNLQLFHFILYL